MKYITMTKGNETTQVEPGRVKRFEEEGWTKITSATSSKPQPKATVRAKAKVAKPKPVEEEPMIVEEEIISDDEHDFLQQNQGFIDDNLNTKEND